MGFWNDKDKEYRFKMVDVYNEQIKDLIKIVPDFKIANATIHFDEVSPHMHIVGVPVAQNCTRGMKKHVGKSKLFTKTSLTEIQDKMRNACIKSFNKFYDMDFKLKEKQKGRNQDINVNEMGNYREIKKKLKQKEQKLEKANTQTKTLDNTSNDVNKILDNLKPTLMNKNNMVISNEDVQKLKNYTRDVKDITKTVRSVNDLNMAIKDFERTTFETIKEVSSLKYEIDLKNTEISSLKRELSTKDKIINKLQTEKEKIKVYNWHIEDADGAYINIDKINAIALNYDNIGTYIEEKCVLAEELGHYYYDATYSLYCQDLQVISKQERKAKKWAYNVLVPYEDLHRAIKNGLTTVYSLANYFEVTEAFISKCVAFYIEKYGDFTEEALSY